MDQPRTSTKFAIVAPDDLAFGLGRMYGAYRRLDERSTKEVGVFRTVAEALAFLGIQDLEEGDVEEALEAAQGTAR
jgi:hypothetical protein